MAERGYRVVVEEGALRTLQKMDRPVQRLIMAYIRSRLDGIIDPRSIGRSLTGDKAGRWRYRVGDYRILALIRDDKLIIYAFRIGHRRDIYNN